MNKYNFSPSVESDFQLDQNPEKFAMSTVSGVI